MVVYRKCLDCQYTGKDLSFNMKFETIIKNQNGISQVVHIHCPKCDSEKLSEHFNTREEIKNNQQ